MFKSRKSLVLVCLTVCLLAFLSSLSPYAKGQDPTARQDQTDVLRVYTELIQTDVMVFDKQGRFVNGLKSADFELRIDGKPKPIEFFEKITAGSMNEESQIAAARGSAIRSGAGKPVAPLDRGRPIFFYIDDLHLDLPSLQTTRKLITHFIDNEMGQNDEAAISSASGQIGFLQQLTDNKTVLRAALARLTIRPYTVRDFETPRLSEYQALRITNYDRDLTDFFTTETMRFNPGITRDIAEKMVTTRARILVQQSANITTNTLSGLESLIRGAGELPGRKVIFFISGGFLLDDRGSDSRYRLQRITSAAARSGVVIYSMDARGLVSSLEDISAPSTFDPSGRLARADRGELVASQDGLNALAADTGGKAVFNTNSLEPSLARGLKDTSTYYLLAWKPENDARRTDKFRRIEVKVTGRPDLLVRVRRGFFDQEPEETAAKGGSNTDKSEAAKSPNAPEKSPRAELHKTLLSAYPDHDLPVLLSLSYIDTPDRGPMLSTALQVPSASLTFAPVEGKQTAVVAIAGAVFDEKGNRGASFDNQITVRAESVADSKDGGDLAYGYPVYVKPGLYQVRVGVREEKTGLTGTAHGWIEIPDLAKGQLTLSSLLLGVRPAPTIDSAAGPVGNPALVNLNIGRRFGANGFLRFLVMIYNAVPAPADSKADVAIQVQVVRDQQPVVTTALKKVPGADLQDQKRLSYAAEISLEGLPAGQYVLQVTAVDRVAKKSATQQSRFEIE